MAPDGTDIPRPLLIAAIVIVVALAVLTWLLPPADAPTIYQTPWSPGTR